MQFKRGQNANKKYNGPDLDNMSGEELYREISLIKMILVIGNEIQRQVFDRGGWRPKEKPPIKYFKTEKNCDTGVLVIEQ